MIRAYFSEVEKRLEEIKWLIKKMIYRWDSAPHHKEIASFPFHLHTPEGVRECDKVNLIEVVDIIKAVMTKRGLNKKPY